MSGRRDRHGRRARGGRDAQRGVGLIEVLAAMLVLSIGFLAAGAMQVRAMRNNQDAYHESQAQLLLADMVDRMHNNPAGVRAGAYAPTSTATVTIDTAACRTSGCDPAELAARDLSEWAESLDPGTVGIVPRLPPSSDTAPAVGTITSSPDGVHTLRLSWRALVDGELAPRSVTTSFRP